MNDYELALLTIGDYEVQRRKLLLQINELQVELDKLKADTDTEE